MKYADSTIGMPVRHTRTNREYRIIGQRVYATDAGACVVDLRPDSNGIYDQGVIHWRDLEPLAQEG